METLQNISLPAFVVFEGVDGSGKTTFARALARYYTDVAPRHPLYANAFPGSIPGTLGEWVYRFHHKKVVDAPSPEDVAPPALQLLHVAAHVDAILNFIKPMLSKGGSVILDRYWWSTYSYLRMSLPARQVWPVVNVEQAFLSSLHPPIVIYLVRSTSLKKDEISPASHAKLDLYYRELLANERCKNHATYEISNDGPLEQTWKKILASLELPYQAFH